jgi:uncharacterized protein
VTLSPRSPPIHRNGHGPRSICGAQICRCVSPLAGLLGRFNPLGGTAGSVAELSLEILDYSGEWLLDLPLSGQSYGEWLDFLGRHAPDARSDAETAQQAHGLYCDFLSACRTRELLTLLQPGRFLDPGNVTDPSLLAFCPITVPAGTRARVHSLAALMESRFDAYKRVIAQPFFSEFVRGVDR